MVIKFKRVKEDQIYEISGENVTLLKVCIIIYFGTEHAFHIFYKVIESGLLLYCPQESDRDNLVKRNYKKYIAEYSSEITECVKTIKKI